MKYSQNNRINQVTECTFVVGVDIGSITSFARAFDWRGIEVTKKYSGSMTMWGIRSLQRLDG